MDYRTPIARARGLGSAHHGSLHWWRQRISALTLVPLGLWFAVCLVRLPNADYDTVRAWFQNPVNNGVLLVFLVIALYHAALGLRVILEDYLHARWLKFSATLLTNALLLTAGLTGVLVLLQLLISV
ncbi:MAG: succinate dehydrogenase, hydrophobic membrane anchor protein [Methylotetracoccus sp.]|jgi:succinate dehydrogenase / fumarate reductase membrane anchor subunit|nr:succinate dehydrogenase, hydrophobic membrane anchor protein [Methylotetracoccus sp.]